MKNICRKYVVVTGIVQGVGFRSFVYNIAVDNALKGWVKNASEGVYINLEGTPKGIELFLHKLSNEAPPLSKIYSITIEHRDVNHYKEFTIEKSNDNDRTITLIAPDIATCKDCEKEILNNEDRRYQYHFTNCTNCGPRFSIAKKIPYDRPMTTMKKFEMCSKCREEYENPRDRERLDSFCTI